MTDLQDPVEVFQTSLAAAPVVVELHPPALERVEVRPYPDLSRLWVRIQISPFSTHPNLALTLLDPDATVVSTLFVVEARQPYQSLTLHLRQPPRLSEPYRLEIELSRDGQVLDTRLVPFTLEFEEPTHGADDH
jgi:hypothetical protein